MKLGFKTHFQGMGRAFCKYTWQMQNIPKNKIQET